MDLSYKYIILLEFMKKETERSLPRTIIASGGQRVNTLWNPILSTPTAPNLVGPARRVAHPAHSKGRVRGTASGGIHRVKGSGAKN
jgi:hypothetical protein